MKWKVLVGVALLVWGLLGQADAQEIDARFEAPEMGLTAVDSSAQPGLSVDEQTSLLAGRPKLELSLAEAVRLTLRKNLNAQVRALDWVSAKSIVESAHAGYDPIFQSTTEANRFQGSTTSAINSAAGQFIQEKVKLDTSLSQVLPIGGSYNLSLSTERTKTNSPFSLLPESFSSTLTLAVNYPLLKDRGGKALKTPIKQAENNRDIAELQLRQELINAVAQTQNDYLDLILARQILELRLKSLSQAKNLLEIARAQERVGTIAPIEVLSAEAGVSTREEAVVVAEAAVLEAEDALRSSMNLPDSLAMWKIALIPSDSPGIPAPEPDFEAAVEQAFQIRPDYLQAKLNLENFLLELGLSRDQIRPQLDFTGSYSYIGNSRLKPTIKDDGNIGLAPEEGIFLTHIEDLLSLDNRAWSVSLTYSLPLRNRAARGKLQRDKLAYQKAMLQLRNLDLAIVTQVRTALRTIESSRKRLAAASITVRLQERQLEAEQKKFQVGTATSFDVLRFEEDLLSAQTGQREALVSLNRAVLALHQALGATLEVNHITIGGEGFQIASTGQSP